VNTETLLRLALGPVVSGVLLSDPVTGSIRPPFTLALYGPEG